MASRARWSNCSRARDVRPVRPPTRSSASLPGIRPCCALSMPVDYWDYLGWKDTLALHGFSATSERLCADARRSRRLHAAGRRQRHRRMCSAAIKQQIEGAIAKPAKADARLSLPVTMTRRRQARLPCRSRPRPRTRGGASAKSGSARCRKAVPIAIGRGENRGQKSPTTMWCALAEARRLERHVRQLEPVPLENISAKASMHAVGLGPGRQPRQARARCWARPTRRC